MSVSVEFPPPKVRAPSKGTAGLQTQLCGCMTSVSALMEAGKATGNASLIKRSIG